MMTSLLRNERTTKLGRLGEQLAAECLVAHGFAQVDDLNARQVNFPFADVMASRDGRRFFIGVKTRNEMQKGGAKRNDAYNLVLIHTAPKAALQAQGLSTIDITAALLAEVHEKASAHGAEAAWVAVAVQALRGTFSAYFGSVAELGMRRSVPMTSGACSRYECLARDRFDPRISADLHNG